MNDSILIYVEPTVAMTQKHPDAPRARAKTTDQPRSATATDQVAPPANSSGEGRSRGGRGRDLFVLLAIALAAAAIGYGLYMQVGLGRGPAIGVSVGAFILLTLVHIAWRRSAQVRSMRVRLHELEAQVDQLRGSAASNSPAFAAPPMSVSAPPLAAQKSPVGRGSTPAAAANAGPSGQLPRYEQLTRPLAGSQLPENQNSELTAPELALAGTKPAAQNARPTSAGQSAEPGQRQSRGAPGQNSGAALVAAKRGETTGSASPSGSGAAAPRTITPIAMGEERVVTSVVPVPPPAGGGSGLGPSRKAGRFADQQSQQTQQAPTVGSSGSGGGQHPQSASNKNISSTVSTPAAGDPATSKAPQLPSGARMDVPPDWPDATSELRRPAGGQVAAPGPLSRASEPQFFDVGGAAHPAANQLDEAFEPVSLSPLSGDLSGVVTTRASKAKPDEPARKKGAAGAAPQVPPQVPSAKSPVADSIPPALPASALQAGVPKSLGASDPVDGSKGDAQSNAAAKLEHSPQATEDLSNSVAALRTAAKEMHEADQRAQGPQPAAPSPKSEESDAATAALGSASDGQAKGPVVIAATDEQSWDGVDEAANIAQRNDQIVDAVATERIELFVTPIHGLDDRKARHLELAIRLKLVGGEILGSADYHAVLDEKDLRPTLDVARLANSAKLAGRLAGSRKKAAVFSNYAAASLANDRFLDELADLLNTQEHLAGHLVLNFSQADVRHFGAMHWDTIDTLQELGFRFALEQITDLDIDFDELKAHGFDFIKLEADLFLHGMPLGDEIIPAADLCRHLVEVGQTLIIGHIEDETKLAKVLGFGVLLGQGSMFGGARKVSVASLGKLRNAAA